MARFFLSPRPPALHAVECASWRSSRCFAVREGEKPNPGGMIVHQDGLPAKVGNTQPKPRSSARVIGEMVEAQNELMQRGRVPAETPVPRYKTLHEAAKNDCAESIAILVAQGVDVDMRPKIENGHAVGWTALAEAAIHSSCRAMDELIKQGADINAPGEIFLSFDVPPEPMHTPILSYALSPESVALLVRHGANLEAKSSFGCTPLLDAVKGLNSKQVVALLKCGADADAKSDSGESALDVLNAEAGGLLYAGEGSDDEEETNRSIWSDYRVIRAALEDYSKKPLSADEMFERGEGWNSGASQNIERAAQWFRRAAEQGHLESQRALGWMHIGQDNAEASKWFRRAAEQGHAESQCVLGRMLMNGNGIPQDNAEASKWLRRAVEQGHAEAQFDLDRLRDE